jgi:hypothetical protein
VGCRLPDPGGSRLVTAASRVMAGAGEGVAVVANRAPVVHRRGTLPGSDRQGVPFKLLDVVDGVARVGFGSKPS